MTELEVESLVREYRSGHPIACSREHYERWIRSALQGAAPHSALRTRWKAQYGSDAPARISRDLLRRALAYRLQERALGGLSAPTRRLLKRLADDTGAQRPAKAVLVRRVGPGSVLVREWSGSRHQVTVLENGVVFREKRYRSLSEVARLMGPGE